MHRLLSPPVTRFEGRIRLPLIQHPGEATIRQLQASLQTRDSLRRVKTTGQHIATGPLPAVQQFLMSEVGYPNTADSMASGLRARNARRLVGTTRGASAGAA